MIYRRYEGRQHGASSNEDDGIRVGDWVVVRPYRCHAGLEFKVGAINKNDGVIKYYCGLLGFKASDLVLIEPPLYSW